MTSQNTAELAPLVFLTARKLAAIPEKETTMNMNAIVIEKQTTESLPVTEKHVMQFHEYANLFPLMDEKSADDLAADIAQNGLVDPVIVFEGKILDGRNRWNAAQTLGIECETREYEGDDPLAFVISTNLKRRHLNESQRAMVAGRLADLELGANQYGSANWPTQKDAAESLSISERALRRAKKVQRDGSPELQEVVEGGKVSVSAAADISTLPMQEQVEIVAKDKKEILAAAKEIRESVIYASKLGLNGGFNRKKKNPHYVDRPEFKMLQRVAGPCFNIQERCENGELEIETMMKGFFNESHKNSVRENIQFTRDFLTQILERIDAE